ncbi:carboxypeptidase [Solibacillus sp. R5-41]|uniref:carboxypeptidase n=1 Tax=Solibacillus sp. R5-41 TaxID=2048654 RepID=UPI000C1259E1|nr:carboxypeptidase [Solibacillus sp. R5-41]ATP41863.1 carboxypeptidase [Solibacillus sp. R5-41]
MKKFLFIVVIFALTYTGLQWISGLFLSFSSNPDDSATNSSMLQSAVTFGGVNYLNVFIYILLSAIITAIIYFTVKSRRSKN